MEKELIIASGPVIIENNKVLLNREIRKGIESPFFMFPGGKMNYLQESPRETCLREVQEEFGLEVEILRPLETLVVERPDAVKSYAVLIHFLAKRKHPEKEINPPTDRTVEWGWFDLRNLPKNCAPNVFAVIEAYIAEHKQKNYDF